MPFRLTIRGPNRTFESTVADEAIVSDAFQSPRDTEAYEIVSVIETETGLKLTEANIGERLDRQGG